MFGNRGSFTFQIRGREQKKSTLQKSSLKKPKNLK